MKKNNGFNFIPIIFIVFALIGLYWLSVIGHPAANVYLWLSVLGIIFIGIATFSKMMGVDFWFAVPINKSIYRESLVMVLGCVFLIVVILSSVLTGLNFYKASTIMPLVTFGSSNLLTYDTLLASTDSFWKFFITVFSAATIEEIVLGWAFVVMGALLLGYGLRKLLNLNFGNNNETWDFVMAIIFSMIMFTVLHAFNSSYKTFGDFMYAAIFRLILNIMIYKLLQLGLMFSIVIHAIHNAVVLISKPETHMVVGEALLSFPGGIIIDAILILIIIFIIFNAKNIFAVDELTEDDFYKVGSD